MILSSFDFYVQSTLTPFCDFRNIVMLTLDKDPQNLHPLCGSLGLKMKQGDRISVIGIARLIIKKSS